MRYAPLFTFILFTTVHLTTIAQPNSTAVVTDLYQRAALFYEEDKFSECLTILDRAETLAGSPDAKLLYLKIKVLYALSQKEEKYKQSLQQAIPVFTEIAKAQNYPPVKIQEIAGLAEQTKNMAKAYELQREQSNRLQMETTRQIDEQMVAIEADTYKMCVENDYNNYFKVSLSSFYCGKYEITNKQWQAIMGTMPSKNSSCDVCPVENISWSDTQDFVKKLNKLSGKMYRLPTEAEWEYLLNPRNTALTKTKTDEIAWQLDNSNGQTHAVGGKEPNKLGIYDLFGNVREWCLDNYDSKYLKKGLGLNPVNLLNTGKKTVRGMSYKTSLNIPYSEFVANNIAKKLQPNLINSFFRLGLPPSEKADDIGFRVCRSQKLE